MTKDGLSCPKPSTASIWACGSFKSIDHNWANHDGGVFCGPLPNTAGLLPGAAESSLAGSEYHPIGTTRLGP